MQPFTTDDDALLRQSPVLKVTYGCRAMIPGTSGLTPGADLTPYLDSGSTITSDVNARISRACAITFDSSVLQAFDYLSQYVQPTMTISNPDTGQSLTVNLGVFVLQTPPVDLSALPSQIQFQGYDLLTLLDVPLGDSFEVAIGAEPVAAAQAALLAVVPWASTAAMPSTLTTTTVLTWVFDGQTTNTWLDVINSLLSAGGSTPLWVDWNGQFQLGTMSVPVVAGFVQETQINLADEYNIANEARTLNQDLYDIPNKWIFVMQNLQVAPVEGETQYTVTDSSASPTSVTSRGRIVPSIVSIATATADAASYTALVSAGNAQVLKDMNPAETYVFTTSPYPLLWHYDRVLLNDPNLASVGPLYSPTRLGVVTQWSVVLDGSSDQSWTLQTLPNL